ATARAQAVPLRRRRRLDRGGRYPGAPRAPARGQRARVRGRGPRLQPRRRPAPPPSRQRNPRPPAYPEVPGGRARLTPRRRAMARHAAQPAPYALDERLAADSHPVRSLPLCELRLMDDANYPWLVLVPRVAGAQELIDLEPAQRRKLTGEVDLALHLLRDCYRPHKL